MGYEGENQFSKIFLNIISTSWIENRLFFPDYGFFWNFRRLYPDVPTLHSKNMSCVNFVILESWHEMSSQNCRKGRFFEIIGKIAFFCSRFCWNFTHLYSLPFYWRKQHAENLHKVWEIGSWSRKRISLCNSTEDESWPIVLHITVLPSSSRMRIFYHSAGNFNFLKQFLHGLKIDFPEAWPILVIF